MKMNRTSAAAAVIAAGLVASLGALAPATVNADELTAAAPAATQSADAEDSAADADAAPSDDAVAAAVSTVALSDESTAAAPRRRLPPPILWQKLATPVTRPSTLPLPPPRMATQSSCAMMP